MGKSARVAIIVATRADFPILSHNSATGWHHDIHITWHVLTNARQNNIMKLVMSLTTMHGKPGIHAPACNVLRGAWGLDTYSKFLFLL